MGQSFRAVEISRLVGISYRRLDYWDRTGLVTPSISEANGSGTQRRYSYEDVVLLSVVVHLLDGGVSLATTRAAIAALRRPGAEIAIALGIGRAGVSLAWTSEELAAILDYGSTVVTVVNLTEVRGALDEAIARAVPGGPRRRSPVRLAG